MKPFNFVVSRRRQELLDWSVTTITSERCDKKGVNKIFSLTCKLSPSCWLLSVMFPWTFHLTVMSSSHRTNQDNHRRTHRFTPSVVPVQILLKGFISWQMCLIFRRPWCLQRTTLWVLYLLVGVSYWRLSCSITTFCNSFETLLSFRPVVCLNVSVFCSLWTAERRVDSNDRVYFVNHNTKTTQWEDPRTQGWAQSDGGGPAGSRLWPNQAVTSSLPFTPEERFYLSMKYSLMTSQSETEKTRVLLLKGQFNHVEVEKLKS